ncbi:MAG: fructosamine kinase family protein [Acidothermus sp.]|nr:fructosamine kinase family protein [Acidothermus sp.]MCL6537300.1 fructosamine kinase family protein [Acidothermus sp.]
MSRPLEEGAVELGAPVFGGDICEAREGRAPDGRRVFVKTLREAPPDFFEAEARGLAWLRVPGGPPVPRVLVVTKNTLVLEWVQRGSPTPAAAREFGRRLATLHSSGASFFGAEKDGYIGTLRLPNTRADSWPEFYVRNRILPFLGGLSSAESGVIEDVCAVFEELAGPSEPPARIHGDLWSGNVLWSQDGQAWLVDAAAAHGGHRETDLAMLMLFGAPFLQEILAGYEEVTPLAPGWRDRVPLHQLHPLLVHATLFGGSYRRQVVAAARAALARKKQGRMQLP